MSKMLFAGTLAALALALPLATAGAATYTSKLEFRDGTGLSNPQDPTFGLVTLKELDAYTVQVTVNLTHADSLFVNTGSKEPFTFNTTDPGVVTVYADDTLTTLANPHDFYDGGRGSFGQPALGNFTNRINCCQKEGKTRGQPNGIWKDENGQSNGRAGPLIFTVYDAAGLTFAGVGETLDIDGRLLISGTGHRFNSNAGGWWFAADIYDGASGSTYVVAAKDAFGPIPNGGIPEPATWAMMIIGFGAAGSMLRRRRTVAI